jgi:hypothetical protein
MKARMTPMLDAWIIEKIKQDEELEDESSRPSISIDLPEPPPPLSKPEPNRGIVIIQMWRSA